MERFFPSVPEPDEAKPAKTSKKKVVRFNIDEVKPAKTSKKKVVRKND